jgi:gamma-glutamyltranspeptidase/glutathione hydrolase
MAYKGAVSSAHKVASAAGASILRKGGNAIDAAVATSLMLGVVEPAFSGIGGGGFALIRLASGETGAVDYRETAPVAAAPDMYLRSSRSDANRIGELSIATPGILAGQTYMLDKYGSMKFSQVAEPAIREAKFGSMPDSMSSRILVENREGSLEKIRRFEASERLFVRPDGSTRRSFKLPGLSKILTRTAEEGISLFYGGKIAEIISKYIRGLGGILSTTDLEHYSPKLRKPIEGSYRGLSLLSMPPPSGGGVAIIECLNILEGFDSNMIGADNVAKLILLIRALNECLSDRRRIGDPDFVQNDLNHFLSKKYALRQSAKLQSGAIRGTPKDRKLQGSTSHFSIIDSRGNIVSATETVECYFGSGVVIPDLDLIMNDEMHDFDPVRGGPNSVAPRKRPRSSMSPTIVCEDNRPLLVLGGAGSERIISSQVQVIVNVVDGKMPLREALAQPRLHPTSKGIAIEGGFDGATVRGLKKKFARVVVKPSLDLFFGGVNALYLDEASGAVVGAADPRRLGSTRKV